jgi:hypothetical protein
LDFSAAVVALAPVFHFQRENRVFPAIPAASVDAAFLGFILPMKEF